MTLRVAVHFWPAYPRIDEAIACAAEGGRTPED